MRFIMLIQSFCSWSNFGCILWKNKWHEILSVCWNVENPERLWQWFYASKLIKLWMMLSVTIVYFFKFSLSSIYSIMQPAIAIWGHLVMFSNKMKSVNYISIRINIECLCHSPYSLPCKICRLKSVSLPFIKKYSPCEALPFTTFTLFFQLITCFCCCGLWVCEGTLQPLLYN